MGFLQILIMIIQYGPAVAGLVREIMKLINELKGKNSDAATVAHEDLLSQIEHYKRTKDKAKLKELRDRLREQCQDC